MKMDANWAAMRGWVTATFTQCWEHEERAFGLAWMAVWLGKAAGRY